MKKAIGCCPRPPPHPRGWSPSTRRTRPTTPPAAADGCGSRGGGPAHGPAGCTGCLGRGNCGQGRERRGGRVSMAHTEAAGRRAWECTQTYTWHGFCRLHFFCDITGSIRQDEDTLAVPQTAPISPNWLIEISGGGCPAHCGHSHDGHVSAPGPPSPWKACRPHSCAA